MPGFRHSKKAKLVALVSGDRSKAKRLATKFGAGAFYTYEELPACFSNPQVEAVYIATNNGSHAHYAVQAANAGKHVLCEKPMANSVEECRQMLEACRASDVRLMIAYRKYFEPASLELKKMITQRETGAAEIHSFGFRDRDRAPGGKSGAWHLDRQARGRRLAAGRGSLLREYHTLAAGRGTPGSLGLPVDDRSQTFSQVDENIAFRLNFPDGHRGAGHLQL